jgi:hypothetical protein
MIEKGRLSIFVVNHSDFFSATFTRAMLTVERA